jgi:hypothetical protein
LAAYPKTTIGSARRKLAAVTTAEAVAAAEAWGLLDPARSR